MALVVDVPLTTTLADLDEALRRLLKRELGRHGFENVEIAFEAPSREWSGKLTGPTVNLFLYDLRQSLDGATNQLEERRINGVRAMLPPPLRLEVTYAITAWTKAVEDEHRLLSQILAVLHSFRVFPNDLLEGRALNIGPIDATLGRPMDEKADFWSAVGGQYKPAIDYAVTIALESGASFTRGPEVRTQVNRTQITPGPRGTMRELTRFGGRVLDSDGAPIADAWVAIPKLGLWTSSDGDGRYIFDRVETGEHDVVVRTMTHGEAQSTIKVPSRQTDITLGGDAPAKGRKKSS